MYSKGKIFKGGEQETSVWVTSLLRFFTSKKLQDNPVSSDTSVYADVLDRGIVLQS